MTTSTLNRSLMRYWRSLDLVLTGLGITSLCVVYIFVPSTVAGVQEAFLIMIAALLAAGVVQFLWRPPVLRQRLFCMVLYHLAMVLACVYFGFGTLFVVGWLTLIILSGIMVNQQAMRASFGLFLGTALLWRLVHADAGVGQFLVIFLEALVVGVIAVIVSHIINISRHRGHELELSRRKDHLDRERLIALVNSMGDAVIAINEKAEIRIYNAAASSLLDTNANLVGKRLSRVLHLRDANREKVDISALLADSKGSQTRTDLRHRFADKEMINLYLNISPIHLGYQRLGERGFILIMRDITKEKSLEQERDEFISVVSHELRTPIAIAEGSISNARLLQKRGAAQGVVERSLDAAYQQVLYLSKMANNLATLSRAERGVHTTEIEPIDIYTLLDELYKNYQKPAEEKGLTFSTKAVGHLEPLATSKLYVQEILQNFITNALKYTEKGSVKLTAHMDGHHRAVFKVQDTGIGISKSDQQHLFEKFFRSEDYRTRESSGTGLGLYLVQKLVQQLGAKVTFTSRLNHGSTFSITVPPLSKKQEK